MLINVAIHGSVPPTPPLYRAPRLPLNGAALVIDGDLSKPAVCFVYDEEGSTPVESLSGTLFL